MSHRVKHMLPVSVRGDLNKGHQFQGHPAQRWHQLHALVNPRVRRILRDALTCLFLLTFVTFTFQYYHFYQKTQAPRQRTVQAHGLVQSSLSRERLQKVEDSFLFAYEKYSEYAWGRDEIKPLTLVGHDTRNGWGATIVDALSTLHIMGLESRFQKAVNFACKIDFSRVNSDDEVSLFETTIRYLAGILSAYELDGARNQCLLDKAIQLGEKLTMAWTEEAVFPYPALNFTSNQPIRRFQTICAADAGSLIIEFDRLSFHSGNDTYRRLAHRTSMTLMKNSQVFPGMHVDYTRIKDGVPDGDIVGWGAPIDSFLEYGPKYWQLVGSRGLSYLGYWLQSVSSSIEHLLHESSDGHLYLYDYSFQNDAVVPKMSHMSCFAPGSWILGGKLVGEEMFVELGLRLAETCAHSYNSTVTKIGPEEFFDNNGRLEVLEPTFRLRPEVLESYWYAWRATGDPVWQERGWAAFEAFERHCRSPGGYSALSDVDSPYPGRADRTESFLFAELFKYFYLLFTPPEVLSLDDYVLNTEAHPFRIQKSTQIGHNMIFK